MQALPNGNVFVGWGNQPTFSEFGSGGELLFDADFLGGAESYRAFRFEWSGRPVGVPDVVAERASDERMTVYASWNGATEVATWQVLAGPGPDSMKPVGSAPRKGFETAITVRAAGPYVAVKAMDGSGTVLGASEAVQT